ncbi:hypothetical protein O6H91_11G118900 [Diphasiastrum complanatum]|uniref:Uncharacterized protein n=1 Tax=Diphasiastrum complanatum TaxID=34168 RepID=A0ACC2CDC0_DIPCM|nr:hypothetical protein O6H91_11G118900 [Diphasiastrum complanatum]
MEFMMMLLSGLVTIFLAYALALAFNIVRYHPFLKSGVAGMPPGSLGLPLLGQTLELLRCFNDEKPDLIWRKRTSSSNFKGLFRTHLFGQPTICITTPELAKGVLMNYKKFGPELAKGVLMNYKKFGVGWPKSFTKLVGGKSFLSMAGESHKRLRYSIYNELNYTQVHALGPAESDHQDIERMDKERRALQLSFNIIAKTILSYEPGKEVDAFGMEVHLLNLALRSLAINLPGIPYNRARSQDQTKARRRLHSRLQSIIHARRDGVVQQASNPDILDIMMQSKDEAGEGLQDEEIIDTILAFMLAGHETTAHSIVWVMYFLQKHPQALQKLKEEHQQMPKGKIGSLSVSDFKAMNFMSRVIDETLRIINLSPFTFRKAMEDVELNGLQTQIGSLCSIRSRSERLPRFRFCEATNISNDTSLDSKLQMGTYQPMSENQVPSSPKTSGWIHCKVLRNQIGKSHL